MQYREFKPRPPLNRFIECYWTLEGETSSGVVQPDRILPDGCVELILNFGAPFTEHDGEKRCVQPQHFVVGQMTGPILISPTGFVELIGIRFQPGGSLPFIPMHMHEVTDQVVELGGLSPSLERQLLGPKHKSQRNGTAWSQRLRTYYLRT